MKVGLLACVMTAAAVAGSVPANASTFLLFDSPNLGAPSITLNGSKTVAAYDYGHFDSNGFHLNNNRNYSTGTLSSPGSTIEYRSFFSFNVTNKPITSASITLENVLPGGYVNAAGVPLELTLYDVSSSIVPFKQYNAVPSIFDDLGTGTVFGTVKINAAATSYTIVLNQAGINAINDPWNFGYVTFGARLTALASPAPEPAAWALMIAGFGLVGGALRARQRRTTVRYA